MKFARLCVVLAIVFACASSVAHAGTNTTLPTQCIADSHPRGCWGNLRYNDIVAGMKYPVRDCGVGPAIDALQLSAVNVNRVLNAKKYPKLFMIPQAEAAYQSLQLVAMADVIDQCATGADPDLRSRVLAAAIDPLYNATDWARVAGSATFFQRYSDRFFERVNAVMNDPQADSWAKEYVLWHKAIYCQRQNPDYGPNYPDYGRLFTWDDFHRVGCDSFNRVS
jgi:hypothetical protein